MFVGMGVSQGVLEGQEKRGKKRREIAALFEEFKKNNPYATAEDFQGFIESNVGPAEYYLRGALPAQDILNRIGEQNEQKRQYDDRMRQQEFMAKNIANANSLREISKSMLLTDSSKDQVLDALLQQVTYPGMSAEDQLSQRKYIDGLLIDFEGDRERERQKYGMELQDRIMAAIERTHVDPNDPQAMEAILGGYEGDLSQYQWMKPWRDRIRNQAQTTWNRKLTEWEQADADRMETAMESILNDQVIVTMASNPDMLPELEPYLRSRMKAKGIPMDQYESIRQQLVNRREILLQAKAAESNRQATERYLTTGTALARSSGSYLDRVIKNADADLASYVSQIKALYQFMSPEVALSFGDFAEDNFKQLQGDTFDQWMATLDASSARDVISSGQIESWAKDKAGRTASAFVKGDVYYTRQLTELDAIKDKDLANVSTKIQLIESYANSDQSAPELFAAPISDLRQMLESVDSNTERMIAALNKDLATTGEWLRDGDWPAQQRISALIEQVKRNADNVKLKLRAAIADGERKQQLVAERNATRGGGVEDVTTPYATDSSVNVGPREVTNTGQMARQGATRVIDPVSIGNDDADYVPSGQLRRQSR